MNRQQVEMQVRLLVTLYRAEAKRIDPASLEAFRDRARELLDHAAAAADGDPRLQDMIDEARREVLD